MKYSYDGHILVVSPAGDIDHHSARSMREEIDDMLYRYRPTLLVIDLAETLFMDSSGLGLILGRSKTATRLGSGVKVVNADEKTMRLLKMAACDKFVEIERIV